ncbi:universal stress protein [Chelativorans alearense]|uniref:universal stress protein n=1 Tax=Chelativorans alearense TaxID=2681495 RepID=UPI0013CF5C57|nr:universal stress protein [Chelativorans alearense]
MLASSSAPNQAHNCEAEFSERSFSSTSSPVLAYVEASASAARRLIPHAMAMAEALSAPLTLLHVLDLPVRPDEPADPVEWSIRRQEAHSRVRRAIGEGQPRLSKLDVRVTEGRPVDQIRRCVRELEACVTVVATKADENAADWELGETARKLIDRSCGALLLVPPSAEAVTEVRYRRLLVPLDGSRMAESVLPLAARLARATGAELLLAHVIPTPELTETGPLEANDHKLRQQVGERNEQVARGYVERIRRRLACSGLAVRSLVVRDGDVRSDLARLVEDERIDLTVMSAHGRSSRPDVACGSVAGYMITHARTPLLVVMGANANHGNHAAGSQGNGRPPRGPVS